MNTCPHCGGNSINYQIVTDTQIKNKHHGFFLVDICWLVVGADKMVDFYSPGTDY